MSSVGELKVLGGRPPLGSYLHSLWSRRQLAVAIPLGALRADNRDSLLGGAWHLLNPLLLAGVYYLIFGLILRADRGVDNFIAFLTTGLFIFSYTSGSITAGARSIAANEALLRSIRFPRAVLPVSAVIGEGLTLGFAVVVMLSVALATGERPGLTWLLLVPILATQTLFNLGAAFVSARLADHVRDVQQVLPFLLRLWLYLSGILFSFDRFIGHDTVLLLLRLNPAYAFVSLARGALLDGGTSPDEWAVALVWTTVLLVGGFAFFRAHEQEYGRA